MLGGSDIPDCIYKTEQWQTTISHGRKIIWKTYGSFFLYRRQIWAMTNVVSWWGVPTNCHEKQSQIPPKFATGIKKKLHMFNPWLIEHSQRPWCLRSVFCCRTIQILNTKLAHQLCTTVEFCDCAQPATPTWHCTVNNKQRLIDNKQVAVHKWNVMNWWPFCRDKIPWPVHLKNIIMHHWNHLNSIFIKKMSN